MRVIVACEQMIQAYASRFASRELEHEDLTATATLGLVEALNRFDDSRSGGGWTGYVGSWMLWKLQQYTGSQRKHVKLTHLEVEQVALLDGTLADASQWGYKAKERGAE
jgi:DNA-directed RNA polymerase sigma subunit (sigma70/sigma32)